MHTGQNCGILLQMSHLGQKSIGHFVQKLLCVCVFGTRMSCAKNGWTHRDAVLVADSCGSNEPCIR